MTEARARHNVTDDQALAIADGIERLSYAVQIIADRCWETMGMGESDRIRKIGGEVNRAICDAFPTLRAGGS